LLAVHPEFQRCGIATTLNRAALHEMKAAGMEDRRRRDRWRRRPRSGATGLREGRVHGPPARSLLQGSLASPQDRPLHHRARRVPSPHERTAGPARGRVR
jgi:predicted N-acetyltransferase YhbS